MIYRIWVWVKWFQEGRGSRALLWVGCCQEGGGILWLALWCTLYSSSRRHEMRRKLQLVKWQRSLRLAGVGAVWPLLQFGWSSSIPWLLTCLWSALVFVSICQNGLVYTGVLYNCLMCHRTRDTARSARPAFRPLFSFSVGLSESIIFTNFYKSLIYCQLRTTKIKVPSNIDSIYIFITFWGGEV